MGSPVVSLIFLIVLSATVSDTQSFDYGTAGRQFGEGTSKIWTSLQGWKRSVQAIAGYVDSFAKEDCEETICSEDEYWEANDEFAPVANGCGSFGYNVDKYIADGMTECCNDHDLCFSKCGASKKKCDEKFKRCLYDVCRDDENLKTGRTVCQISAKMLYGATTLAGCSSFHAAQSSACICHPGRRTSKTHSKRRYHEL